MISFGELSALCTSYRSSYIIIVSVGVHVQAELSLIRPETYRVFISRCFCYLQVDQSHETLCALSTV